MSEAISPSSEPKVSVLMLTYNHEKFIAQAIESVLMQKTDFPFELLIGEDCSTDGTREIVRTYAQEHPAVIRTFLPEENVGVRRNFNRLFEMARGRYLASLEGDDYWTSADKLQRQAGVLDAHPETSLCGTHTVWRHEDGSQPDRVLPGMAEGFYGLGDLLERGFLVHTSSAMFRRVFAEIPGWHSPLPMGDIPLFATLAQYGSIYLLAEAMSVYRIHRGGMWSSRTEIERDSGSMAMWQAFYDHLDPKHRPFIRWKMFQNVYSQGMLALAEDDTAEARKCLRQCLRLPGPGEHLRKKASLAFKAYCWGLFILWHHMRRWLPRR